MATRPTHIAKIVREYETADGEKKQVWTDVGAGWSIKDGQGIKVRLDAFPTNGGEILLLPNDAKNAA